MTRHSRRGATGRVFLCVIFPRSSWCARFVGVFVSRVRSRGRVKLPSIPTQTANSFHSHTRSVPLESDVGAAHRPESQSWSCSHCMPIGPRITPLSSSPPPLHVPYSACVARLQTDPTSQSVSSRHACPRTVNSSIAISSVCLMAFLVENWTTFQKLRRESMPTRNLG